MPLPMMVPTTTAEAWLTPRSRESSAGDADLMAPGIVSWEYTRGSKAFNRKVREEGRKEREANLLGVFFFASLAAFFASFAVKSFRPAALDSC